MFLCCGAYIFGEVKVQRKIQIVGEYIVYNGIQWKCGILKININLYF